MKRWILWVAVVLVMGFAALYGGDCAVFKLRGSPQSSVTVSHMLVVPLKGSKTEYDYLGTADQPCARALFPQAGLSPCWRLRRNPNQQTNGLLQNSREIDFTQRLEARKSGKKGRF